MHAVVAGVAEPPGPAEVREMVDAVLRGVATGDFATTLDGLAGRQLDDFSGNAGDAAHSLDGWPAVPAGALGLAAALVIAGVRPRLAEYR